MVFFFGAIWAEHTTGIKNNPIYLVLPSSFYVLLKQSYISFMYIIILIELKYSVINFHDNFVIFVIQLI